MIILSDNEADFIKSLIRSLKERTQSAGEHDRCGVAIKTLSRKATQRDVLAAWSDCNSIDWDAINHPQANAIEAEVEIRRTA